LPLPAPKGVFVGTCGLMNRGQEGLQNMAAIVLCSSWMDFEMKPNVNGKERDFQEADPLLGAARNGLGIS
jgi:hypothetical protein